MIVTKNENVAMVDVDETLVTWDVKFISPNYIANYYGEEVCLYPIQENIDFLKSLKARGFHVVVHSNNGWAWAEQVVKLLNLEDFVDEVKTKPCKIIDDSHYENWLPKNINLNPNKLD